MKAIHRTTIAFSLSLAILFLIVGTATAGCAYPEHSVTDTRLKHVPYNINGVFTTVPDINYDSSSGTFAENNPGTVYFVTQYDRLFKIMGISGSPVFFAIDDKHGTHFFSHKKEGNATVFRSGIIESDNVFSMRMLNSSGGVVTAQAALAVRNGTPVPDERIASPNITGTWTTAQNSVYQINSQEGNVFSGKITAHGKTTSTRFAGYIDTVDEDGTVKIVMLCEKGNFILGNVNVNTHNITIPYVLYADGRVASSPLTEGAAEWARNNTSYNVTREYVTVLNSKGISESISKQAWLLSVSDENTGRYNMTSASENTTIIGIVQGDNSFIEYSQKTGLVRGFVKGKTKFDFRGGTDLAETSVQSLKQKEGKKSRHSELNNKSEKLNLRNSLERGNFFYLTL
jgi:hypothetical protein